ncbi:hypothetical protein PGTUg99_008644 [Puccinia graminis f. sp. tritici]|uniref:Dienelactone hydrolase domain-containing protein n=1 Tax=Puccinia graminis f. sp. tritici TaxID=56615 RepID=A0A5B0RSM3_PUCGR|nr:hypothetical protein PGTUg99_008644 [Puccinia graminis f. sp. tritici]
MVNVFDHLWYFTFLLKRLALSGKPSGRIQSINRVNVYVENPTSHDSPESQSSAEGQKAILVFPDVFGIDLINVQLITDKLATDLNTPAYLVDTFAGGDIQPNKLPVGFHLTEWQKNHRPEQVLPIIETVIKNLTAQSVEGFAATGYCFGKHLPCCFKSPSEGDHDCVSANQD